MAAGDDRVLGKEFARNEQHVTRQMLLEYAATLGTVHPIYVDAEAARAQGYRDIIAMPTFITANAARPLAPAAFDFHGLGINAGYDCCFYGVIYPDDTLTYSTSIADLYEKTGRSGKMRFVVRETTVTNQHGEHIALVRNAFILDW
jgi:acyl dehydratase